MSSGTSLPNRACSVGYREQLTSGWQAQVHGDLTSSNVLLTRRGGRGVCGRLGMGRLRAKVGFICRILPVSPPVCLHGYSAADGWEFVPAQAPATRRLAWSITHTANVYLPVNQPDMRSNACPVLEHFMLRHMVMPRLPPCPPQGTLARGCTSCPEVRLGAYFAAL